MNSVDLSPAIDLRGVSKRLGTVTVLDRVTLSLEKGLRHALVGPNGSGKTTLLRMLAGLIIPDAGEAHCLGFDLRTPTPRLRHQVAYVTQHFSLYGELTVRENLAFEAALCGVPAPARAITRVLDDLNLRAFSRARAQTLSGGARQRLMLAAALLRQPALLLLDEPTASLDGASRAALWRELDARRTSAMTLILTTHLPDDAGRCDTVTQLVDGSVRSHYRCVQLSSATRGPAGESAEEIS